ncbi:hypothetical protein [Cylindrospermum sp. FACHB-282]|uniref:hypothetical protein n=1 Tax=Cylindrospermum sp. FACHB-282 TaxID=2692794 RepID=UPI001688348C|nr:hypothetical protein [Cylindrospermum sp. FACHB-282]MBD2384721.1 hypothetical protein [Cylindrospermum sp. FACHB-282]
MILSVKTSPPTTVPKLSYDVLIETQQDGTVQATLLSLPDVKSSGASKEEALNNLIQLFQARKPEIVTLEIEPPKTEHPRIKFAGIIKDEGNAWDLLETLTGTIEAPSDWSSQHDYYLYSTPKHPDEIIE